MAVGFPLQVERVQGAMKISTRQFHVTSPQNISRTAAGATLRASLGEPVWRGAFQLPPTNDRSRMARDTAVLSVLDRAGGSFLVYDPAKTHPADDPAGAVLGNATPSIRDFDVTDARYIALKGLPAPQYWLRTGDYIGWISGRRNLFDQTEELNGSAWEVFTGASLPVSVGGGKGFSDWWQYTLAGSSPARFQQRLGTVYAGEIYTASFHLDSIESSISGPAPNRTQFTLGTSGASRASITINLDDFSILSAGATTYAGDGTVEDTILLDYGREDLGSGVYRYWLTAQATLERTWAAGIWESDSATAGDTLVLTGAQAERESGLTNYQFVTDGSGLGPKTYHLHQLAQDTRSDDFGDTLLFEATPYVQPTIAVGDPVSLIKPVMKATLDPDPSFGSARAAVSSGAAFSFTQTLD